MEAEVTITVVWTLETGDSFKCKSEYISIRSATRFSVLRESGKLGKSLVAVY